MNELGNLKFEGFALGKLIKDGNDRIIKVR